MRFLHLQKAVLPECPELPDRRGPTAGDTLPITTPVNVTRAIGGHDGSNITGNCPPFLWAVILSLCR